mgnify:CR=1 FL=1
MTYVLAFLFTPVAARAIAIVGTNPVSGMTLMTLIISSVILNWVGLEGDSGIVAALDEHGSSPKLKGVVFEDKGQGFDDMTVRLPGAKVKVGDLVKAAGYLGVVGEIGLFVTVMNTLDNQRIIIPNSKLTGDNIINYSAMEQRRIDLVFGIGYDDDIDKAKQLIAEILAADDRVLKDPAPQIAVSELADSSVNFVARPWAKTGDYWEVFFDTTEAVKKRFDAEGISIPYPQSDVHVYQQAAAA